MSLFSKWKLQNAGRRAEKLIAGMADSKIQDEIIQMGDAAVPALRQALGTTDEKTRRHASYILYCIATPAARDAIAGALADESPDVRYSAVTGLGALRDVRALESLLEYFRAGKTEHRKSAAQYLGYIGDARALEALTAYAGGDAKLKGFVSDAIARIRMRGEQTDRGTRALARLKDIGRKMENGRNDQEPWSRVPISELMVRWRIPAELFSKHLGYLTCDLCSRDFVGSVRSRSLKVPAGFLRDSVKYGYNPVLNRLDPRKDLDFLEDIYLVIPGGPQKRDYLRKAVEGIDQQGLETYFRFWKEMAMKSTTDWALCPDCAKDLVEWEWGEETWNRSFGR